MGKEEAGVASWCVVLLFVGIYGSKAVILGEDADVEGGVGVGV